MFREKSVSQEIKKFTKTTFIGLLYCTLPAAQYYLSPFYTAASCEEMIVGHLTTFISEIIVCENL